MRKEPLKENLRKVTSIKLLIGTVVVLAFCGASPGCCGIEPMAALMGSAPDYVWGHRSVAVNEPLQTDSAASINEPVSVYGSVTEYSFKVGEDSSTNCLDPAGYSEWTPKTQNLTADLSAFPNTTLRLCLVGRGTDPCGKLRTQGYDKASVYRWILNRSLGNWNLTAPIGVINSTHTTATWTASENVVDYRVFVSSSASCSDSIVEAAGYNGTSASLTLPGETSYYLCGEARDGLGTIKPANNSGVKFTVFSQTQQIILRNSISLGSPSTALNLPIGNHSNMGATPWYQLGIVKVRSSSKMMLTSWSAHMDGSMPSPEGFICGPDLLGFSVHLRAWVSLDNARDNPTTGTLANLDMSDIPPVVRQPTGGISPTSCPIELIEYDLSSHAFVMLPNVDYYIAMDFSSLSGVGGVWGIMESDEGSTPDWIIYDELDQAKKVEPILSTTFPEIHTGALAVKLSGWTVP